MTNRALIPSREWLKWPIVGLLALFLDGCGEAPAPPVEPPEPPPTTSSIPEPPRPPRPPDPPGDCRLPDVGRGETKCYVTVVRAGTRDGGDWRRATGLIREMMVEDQELINTSRNFLRAADRCPDHFGNSPFSIMPAGLRLLGVAGLELHDGGRSPGETISHPSILGFVGEGSGEGKLQQVNHRYPKQGDEWKGRTEVFRPVLSNFRAIVAGHLDVIRDIDGRAAGYDGVCAWLASEGCSCR